MLAVGPSVSQSPTVRHFVIVYTNQSELFILIRANDMECVNSASFQTVVNDTYATNPMFILIPSIFKRRIDFKAFSSNITFSFFFRTGNMKINITKMSTPIEEKVDQNLKIRTGMVMISDGKSKPELARLHLSMEILTLQKQDTSTPTPTSTSNPAIESKVS